MGLPVEKKLRYTLAEYLEMEKTATEKHEFHQGEIRCMSGGTLNHSLIIANCIGELRSILKGKPCRVFDSNLRIGVPRSILYTYPDLTVICGKAEMDPRDSTQQTALNPRLIVEVLSPTSEGYDRGDKFNFYRQIETFEEYILISQIDAKAETFFKQNDGTWLFSVFTGPGAKLNLRSLGIELVIDDLFAGVEFPKPELEPGISA